MIVIFENVTVTTTSNDAGTYQNLNITSSTRPSQLTGRARFFKTFEYFNSSDLFYTVTTNKTLYVTDIVITIVNESISKTGKVNFRDGLDNNGTTFFPIYVNEGSNKYMSTTVIQHSYQEPLKVESGIYIEEVQGTVTICGHITGYEE